MGQVLSLTEDARVRIKEILSEDVELDIPDMKRTDVDDGEIPF